MGFIPTSTAAGLTALDDGDVTPGPLAEAKAVLAKAIDDHGASIVGARTWRQGVGGLRASTADRYAFPAAETAAGLP